MESEDRPYLKSKQSALTQEDRPFDIGPLKKQLQDLIETKSHELETEFLKIERKVSSKEKGVNKLQHKVEGVINQLQSLES